MADDDVGLVAELLQVGRGVRHNVGAPHRCIELAARDMRLHSPRDRFWVGHCSHPGNLVRVGLAEEHHVMPTRRNQMPDDVQILTRKVLVDEQIFHTATLLGGGTVAVALCQRDRRLGAAGWPARAAAFGGTGLGAGLSAVGFAGAAGVARARAARGVASLGADIAAPRRWITI